MTHTLILSPKKLSLLLPSQKHSVSGWEGKGSFSPVCMNTLKTDIARPSPVRIPLTDNVAELIPWYSPQKQKKGYASFNVWRSKKKTGAGAAP